jgi:hypothetical protein
MDEVLYIISDQSASIRFKRFRLGVCSKSSSSSVAAEAEPLDFTGGVFCGSTLE